jgi:hypothetical protein
MDTVANSSGDRADIERPAASNEAGSLTVLPSCPALMVARRGLDVAKMSSRST